MHLETWLDMEIGTRKSGALWHLGAGSNALFVPSRCRSSQSQAQGEGLIGLWAWPKPRASYLGETDGKFHTMIHSLCTKVSASLCEIYWQNTTALMSPTVISDDDAPVTVTVQAKCTIIPSSCLTDPSALAQ
jgi:hypothetical protein